MKVTLINPMLKMLITLECDNTIQAKNALKHEAVEVASKHTDSEDNHFAYWNKLRDYHNVSDFLDITIIVEQTVHTDSKQVIKSIQAIVYKSVYNFVHTKGLKSNAFSSHFYSENAEGEILVVNHIVYRDSDITIKRWFY